jgi:hypothetical protein
MGKNRVVGMTNWLKQFLQGRIIHDVPGKLSLCEFDCRIDDCKLDDWKQCKTRIAYLEQLSRISVEQNSGAI